MLRAFVVMRLLVGGQTWLAPNLSARMVGFDPGRNPQSAYWARLFGIRDVALGMAALQTEGEARRKILQVTAACDAADFAAALMAKRGGYVSAAPALLVAAFAAAAGTVASAAAVSET